MHKLNFSIVVNASKKKVWNTMLDADSYRAWTEVFMPGSHYLGDWNKGSKILFLAPDKDGNLSGMVGWIKENRLHEYISIEYLGIVLNGKEETSGEAVNGWAGAHENYTFNEINGTTELQVYLDMDKENEFTEMLQEIWPKALQNLKDIAEK